MRLGDPGERRDVEHLAARGRVDARGRQGGLGRRRGRRPAPRSAARSSCGAGRRRRRRRANTCSRLAVVAGGSRRVPARPGPESTLGTGQKTLRGDRPRPAYVGVPGGLDRRHAVGARARAGGQPVGHLGLHHHQAPLERRAAARAGAAAPAPRRCRAGWRPARSAAGRGPRSSRSASASTTVEPVGQVRARARRPCAASRGASRRRPRRATTCRPPRAAPGSASRGRARPRGPRRPARPRTSRTIRRTVLASMTKFWPRCLVGRRSSSAASRTHLGRPRAGATGGLGHAVKASAAALATHCGQAQLQRAQAGQAP